ncbi:mannosyl-oligosaccharide 1,2-alpha-mannosidase [Thecamonas trahens ATCC 50062]|uniref:alpha-1,2-Mannosidase n=1 Tax=Thecamonas trahens ATCC 50062 TaxID=461836 RepID=A0A0L0DBH8_THETB|nr:mannosyl-oligosaccharide 1,2-alpha-mannosidase [Thecamonas trahens ATCC 50062]KNC49575.1 mannosyl-oligosaccharide 1,2-alpha-mannosidase [Thecamonas trahens ATCC 50062]|eukprot:XP_013757684.1 mannosyl-oligosaccharide 1,2-alpha-mannosidase [Thecamonas trahens ATCC 50062]
MRAVREAMKHAWGGYVEHAWGADDLKPVSKSASNWLGGSGATVLDALSTLHIMGLSDEFAKARGWVADVLTFDKRGFVSTFETNIRSLGGLLSAYDLSGDAVFLEKAIDLGNRLLEAFKTPTGLPNGLIDLATGQGRPQSWAAGGGILSEMGTMQLEFKVLSQRSGDDKYAKAAEKVIDLLDALPTPDGLYPLYVSLDTGTFRTNQISLGALGDSFYEYLLKQWLLTSKTEPKYRRMYDETVAGIRQHLVARSTKSGLTYVAERMGNRLVHKMDHLACFLGGMFALGAESHQLDDEVFSLGAAITETCHQLYARSPSGIAPEFVNFNAGGDDFVAGAPYYLLRPETVESMFIMWRLTHDQQYRDMGWAVFLALEKMCKVPSGGYSGLKSTLTTARTWDDAQPSYFLAETLKYLYLLFTDDSVIPLNEWVFNTEAHPLRVWDPTTA